MNQKQVLLNHLHTEEFFTTAGTSLTYIRNRSGPKMDPWGTLHVTF